MERLLCARHSAKHWEPKDERSRALKELSAQSRACLSNNIKHPHRHSHLLNTCHVSDTALYACHIVIHLILTQLYCY